MNFYNPYFGVPTALTTPNASRGLLRGLFGRGINWGSILNNTQRTLGIINQAIPVVKQVSPIVNNAKTMFRVMNEFKKVETPTSESISQADEPQTKTISENNHQNFNNQGPTFFA